MVEHRNATPYQPATVWLITCLIILVLGLATGAILYLSYVDTQRQQKNNLLNIATALSAQTATVAQAVNRNLRQVNRMYLAREDRKLTFVFPAQERDAPDPLLIDVVLYDLRGQLVGYSVPARANVRAQAAPLPGSAGLSITDVDPKTGTSLMRIERPLLDDDGSVIGTIVGRLDSTRLGRLYSLISLGRGGSVTLFRRDGLLLIRGPAFPAMIGRSFGNTPLFTKVLPAAERGVFEGTSPLDGQDRLYGYAAVEGFPLLIVTGMNRDVAMVTWYERLWISVIFYALVLLGLVYFAWRVSRDAREQSRLIARMAYLADYDALTGLPNQPSFWRGFEQAIERAGAGGYSVAIIVLQLERLHEIIDLLGQGTGNRALSTVGAILAGHLRPGVTLARVRGSEFAFLVSLHERGIDLAAYATTLFEALSHPVSLERREFYLAPFFGIAVYPQDGGSADELYRSAQSASHPGDNGAHDAIQFYSGHVQVDMNYRLALEAELRQALARGEMRLVFQPKVTVAASQIVGVEALLRWTNKVLGEVSPADFIPVAEHSGLIVSIGAWVLEEACRVLAQLQRASARPCTMAVNLSPRQLHQKDLLDMIEGCMRRHGIGKDMLELEITETALMSREDVVDVLLQRIRDLGVTLSIDDFGTGYSSLAYLKRFPVQRLKVDRAFVRDLGQDDDSAVIAMSIMNLARGLRMKVVAEGVEDAAQLAILTTMGCDEYQGFYFSRPIEQAALEALLAA
ncbi:putative bifunctional diguanylate cyclase/phosphodiesterase [Massilia sp. S19_KUP03_FR1]|uniref:putative bifunctional diguanylate cyclase/phosphodiesterase n=1 Tax=Massilia sp. S19_KUP03_FR1 TaxID=3025503 RepID=UPI002FCD5E44